MAATSRTSMALPAIGTAKYKKTRRVSPRSSATSLQLSLRGDPGLDTELPEDHSEEGGLDTPYSHCTKKNIQK